MYDIFKCPNCSQPMSLPSCSCHYSAAYHKGIYQLTDDPYMVKDDSAEVKYIGYEDIGESYSGDSLFKKISIDEKYTKIRDIIGGGIMLDLACGDGLYTVPLIKLGVKVISMDISDKMLSLLYKRAETEEVNLSDLLVCRANALDIPLIDGSVDAVIADSVLHLISKPEKVVGEICRVLKKGGKYIAFQEKPNGKYVNENGLTEEEKSENKKYNALLNFVHNRYFQILANEYSIKETRYSWNFDREKICGEVFDNKEVYIISVNGKIADTFKNLFLSRMGSKGFSDQSDVPQEIHKEVFHKVMIEFIGRFGDNAADTVFTGYKNNIEMSVYAKS